VCDWSSDVSDLLLLQLLLLSVSHHLAKSVSSLAIATELAATP
jgi:hypothetical protein